MRDINEAITKAPFNKELSGISIAFGKLLRAIVETMDRRGLKFRYLRKHERDVEKFFRDLRKRCSLTILHSLSGSVFRKMTVGYSRS